MKKFTLQELQDRGLVTRTKQYSGGIGWGYRVFKSSLGQMSSSVWSKKEVTENQEILFPFLFS